MTRPISQTIVLAHRNGCRSWLARVQREICFTAEHLRIATQLKNPHRLCVCMNKYVKRRRPTHHPPGVGGRGHSPMGDGMWVDAAIAFGVPSISNRDCQCSRWRRLGGVGLRRAPRARHMSVVLAVGPECSPLRPVVSSFVAQTNVPSASSFAMNVLDGRAERLRSGWKGTLGI